MKRRHLLLAALSLIISVCLGFCLTACNCNSVQATALTVPVVSVDESGVASWAAVENASGYAYKISDGEEQTTDTTSVTLTDGQSIVVKAVGDGTNFTDSAYSEAVTYTKPPVNPVKLDRPVVTIADGVASWAAVENASGYKYSVDNGENWSNLITALSTAVESGQTIIVKAIGDGTAYLDSDISDAKTAPTKLGAPTVEIDDETGVVTVTADDNATKVVYTVGDGEAQDYNAESKPTLQSGQKITVTAKGNGTTYLDSDPVEKTYIFYTPITHAEFVSANKGDIVCVSGVVTAFRGKNIFLMDTDGGYYAYNAKTVPENLAIGMTVKVTGKKDVYNGLDEIVDAKVVIKNATPALILPATITPDVTAATGADDATLLAKQNMYVLVRATIESDEYGTEIKLAVGTNKITFHASGSTQVVTSEQQATIKAAFAAANGRQADVKGIVAIYKGAIQLVPAGATPLSNVALNIPVVTVDDNGLASWTADEKATGYKYSLDNGANWTDATGTSVQLSDGQKVKVKAVGVAPYVAESEASEEVTYSKIALTAPTLSATTSGVSWTAVEHADHYEYRIDDGDWQTATGTALDGLNDGVKVEVIAKAAATGKYKDSDVAKIDSLTKLTTLPAPTLAVTIDGTVSWSSTEQGVTFKYTLSDPATATDWADLTAVKLTDNQTISVKVYKDTLVSEAASLTYKAPQQLTAPVINSISITGTATGETKVTFTKVEHASSYAYAIGDGETVEVTASTQTDTTVSFNVALSDGAAIKVIAVGYTGDSVEDGDYSSLYTSKSSEASTFTISADKTYTVTEMVKIATYYGETANIPENKQFKVTGMVSENTAYSTKYKNIDITLKEGDVTFVVFRAVVPNDAAEALKTQITGATANSLAHYTITATGLPIVYNDTPEFTSGCIVNNIELSDAGIALFEAEAKAQAEEILNGVTLTPTPTTNESDTITYSLPATAEADGVTNVAVSWTADGYTITENTITVTKQSEASTVDVKATISCSISYLNDKTTTASVEKTLTLNIPKVGATATPLDVPQNLAVTLSAQYADSVKLNWTAVKNAQGYAYVIGDSTPVTFDKDEHHLETVENTVTAIIGLTTAEIKVKALGDDANTADSELSQAVTYTVITTETDTFIPSAPAHYFTNGQDVDKKTFIAQETSITFGRKEDQGTTPKYYINNDPKGIRTYVNNTITFTVTDNKLITEIVLTYSQLQAATVITATDGAGETPTVIGDVYVNFTDKTVTWRGSATTVVLTRTGAGVNAISQIAVKHAQYTRDDSSKVALALASIPTLNASYDADFVLANKDSRYGLNIVWTSSNNAAVNLPATQDGDVTTATVTRGATDADVTLTATITCSCGVATHHSRDFENIKIPKQLTGTVLQLKENFATYTSEEGADWSTTYKEREISFNKLGVSDITGNVNLSRCNKSASNSAIPDMPVLAPSHQTTPTEKNPDIPTVYATVSLDAGQGSISSVTFTLKQWKSVKFSDIHIEYYDGSAWQTCSVVINNTNDFPTTLTSNMDFNATKVRLSVTSTDTGNKQIGLEAITLTVTAAK